MNKTALLTIVVCIALFDFIVADLQSLQHLKVYKSKFGVIGLGSGGATVFGNLAEAGEDVIGIDIGPDLEGYPWEPIVRNLDQHKMLSIQGPQNPSEVYYQSLPQEFCYYNGTCFNKTVDLRRFHMVAGCNRHNNGLPRPGVDKFLDDWKVKGWKARDIRPYFDQVARQSRFQLPRQDRANQTKFMRRFANAGFRILDDSEITEETRIGISRNVFQLKQVSDEYFERVSSYDTFFANSRKAQRFGRKFSSMRADQLVTDAGRVDENGNLIILGVVATNMTSPDLEQILFLFEEETIVALGAYDTITLMMRSGFGPCSELEAMGIQCLVDIPKLGKTLNDHFVLAAITNTSISEAIPKPNTQFTTINAISFADNGESYPTVIMDVYMETGSPLLPPPYFPNTVGFVVILSVKNFAGTVSIDSTDHYKPAVDLKLFKEAWHMPHFKRMFNEYRRIIRFNEAYTNEIVPGPQVTGEEATHNYIVENLAHGSHPCCTAAMGNRTEIDSVVDENLLVRKLSRLSIADTSVAKTGIHANTNWLTISIGLKASDLILDRARERRGDRH